MALAAVAAFYLYRRRKETPPGPVHFDNPISYSSMADDMDDWMHENDDILIAEAKFWMVWNLQFHMQMQMPIVHAWNIYNIPRYTKLNPKQ